MRFTWPGVLLLLGALNSADSATTPSDGLTEALRTMLEAMSQLARDRPWERQDGATPPKAPFSGGFGFSNPFGSETHRLDGLWVSQTGERLWIRGDTFRLDAGAQRSLEGRLELRDNQLSLYSPLAQRRWVYEYAEQDGRLALRDPAGNLFLYRRMAAP